MHVLFVHQNFPAQFGHIARCLVKEHGVRCTFVSQHPPGHGDGAERIQYHLKGRATERTHYWGRSFENAMWHSHAVYEALRVRPDMAAETRPQSARPCASEAVAQRASRRRRPASRTQSSRQRCSAHRPGCYR
jgi:hypothetical protein